LKMKKNIRLEIAFIISISLLLLITFLYCGCNRTPKENVDAETPISVMELLLQAIERKDWKMACEHLSSDFLRDNKEKVMAGAYFTPSGKKDRTSFYTSQARVCRKWKLADNGAVALVTLNIGGEKPGASMGILEVKLIKEHDYWKVSEF